MCLFHTFYDIPSPGQSYGAVILSEKYRPRLRQVQDGHGENGGKKTPKLHMKGETGISKMILRFYNLDQLGIVELHVKVGWCFCVLFSPTA